MGNRLSKIYTRTGDHGSTGLGDGTRVAKDHVRVEAYGTVDELNACLGMLRAQMEPGHAEQALLGDVQHDLFDLGGELCIPGYKLLRDGQVELLEAAIDRLNEKLPPLKDFILPGGNRAAAAAHLARTVCRRAERRTYSLAHGEDNVRALPLQYLNRLSDYLFVLARTLAREHGDGEVLWNRQR